MHILKTLGALVMLSLGSLGMAACAVAPAAEEETKTSAEALGGTGDPCTTDASCHATDVCDLFCPVIPGRFHCEIVGGTCEPRAMRFTASLHGETFTSGNGVHSITFAADGTFQKTDGCDPSASGIRCHHIQLTTGTYKSSPSGTSIHLTSTLGASDTLTVEPHPYDGLLDQNTGVQLYPAP